MSANIFGVTNTNNSVHGVRQPEIGIKFLDDEGNSDIDNKRLANLSMIMMLLHKFMLINEL